jgi:hypothetical protein
LIEKGLVTKNQPVKILNNGELKVKVSAIDVNISKSAEGLFTRIETVKEVNTNRPAKKSAKKIKK